jgi:hypothetical protein
MHKRYARYALSPYHDTPHTEDVLYIFNIGRYNAKQHYTIGITHDIHTTKFMHAKTFPVAKCIYETPIENNHAAVQSFFDTLSPVSSPVAPSEYIPSHIILIEDIQQCIQHIDTLLAVQERFGGG